MSVIKGLPLFVKVQEIYNKFSRYPTLKRVGDVSRQGTDSIFFNDSKTVVFDVAANGLNYPLAVDPFTNPIEDAALLTNLVTEGYTRQGIGDAYVFFKNPPILAPYNDRTFNFESFSDKEKEFYLTGTEGYPGFATPTTSKTCIEIEIPVVGTSSIGVISGSMMFMGYHNFTDGTLKPVSPAMTWFDHVDFSTISGTVNQLSIGFGPSCGSSEQSTIDQYGLPVDFAGFPNDYRFEASSDHLLPMKDYISKPFLLEKIKLEFKASFDPRSTPSGQIAGGVSVVNFFILNQKNGNLQPSPRSIVPSTNDVVIYSDPSITDKHIRDIVTFGRISSEVTSPSIGLSTEGRSYYDLTFAGTGATIASFGWDGQYTMLLHPKAPMRLKGTGTIKADQGGTYIRTRNIYGGRNGLGCASGRELKTPLPEQSSPITFNIDGYPVGKINVGSPPFEVSPYILLPEDKLILGWQLPLLSNYFSLSGDGGLLTINPGTWKLTLYGSLIQEQKEFHDGLNQHLTSISIHETIGSEPIVDQFDVAQRQEYFNSYSDWMTRYLQKFAPSADGALPTFSKVTNYNTSVGPSLLEFNNLTRSSEFFHVGSVGSKTSSFGFCQLNNKNERFYDSVMPRWSEINAINGGKIVHSPYAEAANFGLLTVDIINYYVIKIINNIGGAGIAGVSDDLWVSRCFFSSAYSAVNRDPDIFPSKIETPPTYTEERVAGPPSPVTYTPLSAISSAAVAAGKKPLVMLQLIKDTTTLPSQITTYDGDNDGDVVGFSDRDFAKYYFGYKPSFYLSFDDTDTDVTNYNFYRTIGAKIEGWRYGIYNAMPSFSKAIFNRNRYGHFRDMFEQRLHTKFYDINKRIALDSPVIITYTGEAAAPTGYDFVCYREARVTEPYSDRENQD